MSVDSVPPARPGWAKVTTASWHGVGEAVREVVALRAVACVTGVPGTGKSTAVASALEEGSRAGRVVWLAFRTGPTMRQWRDALWARLCPGTRAPRVTAEFERAVTRALALASYTLVVDDADVLPRECLEYLAALADDRAVDVAIVVIGSPRWGVALAKKAPRLNSFVFRRVSLEALTDDEAWEIAASHPTWIGATRQEVAIVNRDAAGTLRGWEHATEVRAARGVNALSSPSDVEA